jgi:A/G-specific adenine glycosylase
MTGRRELQTGQHGALPEAGRLDAAALLRWYEGAARDLPWRIGPGARAAGVRPDPYRVWLSEVMLQQTTIAHATAYFLAFTQRWPDVAALARAPDADVMAAWAGLGYYSRARNLLACARAVMAGGGAFPATLEGLRALPGVGAYTAGAVGAIAFGLPVPAVDGNVERVVARLMTLSGDWAAQKRVIAAEVSAAMPVGRSGEFAEALMDLGATVCRPRRPDCANCPLQAGCLARESGTPEAWPQKPRKAAPMAVSGEVWVVVDSEERVFVEQRPAEGLLGGMVGLPGSAWGAGVVPVAARPPWASGMTAAAPVSHVFTHLRLSLDVQVRRAASGEAVPDGLHAMPVGQARQALPSVFRKALASALGALPD